jgi:hypothetical protein
MTYGYQEDGVDCFFVYNVETRSYLGYVRRQGKNWRVEAADENTVAVVASQSDAGQALADYYEKHRKWQPDGQNGYCMWTEFGELVVRQEQEQPRWWFVHRNDEQPLERDGEAVTFPTPEEAQCAAFEHRSDGSAGSTAASDGLSWFMPEKIGGALGHWPALNSKVTN